MSLVIEGSCNDGKELRGDDFSEIDSFGDLEDMSELGMFSFQFEMDKGREKDIYMKRDRRYGLFNLKQQGNEQKRRVDCEDFRVHGI
ncbi:hypothetical protein MtrunA17_Chr3g0113241 [Medicago truncatula]|uniref:Uncharacterized protein n=1 Tax=Medicago truncatula TaxID=3880 RepID=A0A396IUS1_MEDTR|nr:hypothetical protein MtrunA17_Chr3g0113241 [Medicago truncatula]